MSIESEITRLSDEVEKIKARNKRVEGDKLWETSWTRRIFIAASTYILVVIFLFSISADRPFLTAIIPASAYLISTTSIGFIKFLWLKKRK